MRFHEEAGNAHGHGGTRQHRHHLALTAAAGALRISSAGQLHRVRGVKHHGRACLAHDRQAAHVAHQVVVAKACTALTGHEAVFVQAFFARCSAGLVDHVFHVARGQELALLDVDWLARLRHSVNEVGLAAQKSRRLQHVDHGRHRSNIGFRMHVGEHRHV